MGLFLALLRQGILFIPMILILSYFFGENGVWISFPLSDLIATLITGLILRKEIKKNL
jgi:Na+-driven multidrug efflux pump